MKNMILIVLSLFISQTVLSQEISKEQIYGTWKVQKNLTPTSDPKLNDIIDGFNEATFTFYENGNFVLQSNSTSKLFSMTLNMLKNAKCKLDQKRQMIQLGNQENYFSIMGIAVKVSNDKTFFLINETPIELEMVNN